MSAETAGSVTASGAAVRRMAREGGVVAAAHAAVALGRLVTVVSLTRLMEPASYGLMAQLQGIATLGFSLAPAPMLQSVLRFHPTAERNRATGDMRRILKARLERLAAVVAVITAIATVAWIAMTGRAFDAAAVAGVIAAMAIIVPDTARGYDVNVLNATRAQRAYSVWTALDALVRPVGAILAILIARGGTASALTGTLLVVLVTNVVCARALVREPKVETPHGTAWMRDAWPGMKRYAAPLAPLALFVWIVGLADRYVLASLFGDETAGLYAAAYGLAGQPFVVLGMVGLTIVRPRLFSAVDAGDLRRARRAMLAALGAVLGCAVAGVALLALLADPLTHVLGSRYRSNAPLLAWIGAAFAFLAAQMVLEVLVYARHRTGRLLLVQAASAAVAAALYALLIPRWGARGAAVATLGAYATSCALTALTGDLAGLLRLSPAWRGQTGPEAR